jgi:ribonucleoside-diphosphate reductase alpha chain
MMQDQGFPWEADVMKPDTTVVFSFPMKSPEGAVMMKDRTAIEQLETWLIYQRHWCEHKPSVTINVRENEWMAVGAWVFDHFDEVSGVTFLPYREHSYAQAPYQECSEADYELALSQMPQGTDWGRISDYEDRDNTVGSQTLACSAGVCDLVDL